MGGPRASTMRQIEAGKRCCKCGRQIDTPPWRRGERKCEACLPHRRVFCNFFHRDGWTVQFLEEDVKTPVGRMLTFASPEKIRELVGRTPTKFTPETQQELDYDIGKGRGGLYLDLTETQYRRLRGGI